MRLRKAYWSAHKIATNEKYRGSLRVLLRSQIRRIIRYRSSPKCTTFAFVGGLHRSGTSLLTRLLASHPDISTFEGTWAPEDEGQHLQRVIPTDPEMGGPGRFAFHELAHLTEKSSQANSISATRMIQEWGYYTDFSSKIFIEKSPTNIVRSRFLQALFPDSIFVFIVRHPIPNMLATRRFSKLARKVTNCEIFAHWAYAHKLMLDDMEHIGKCTLIRYEDFITNPEQILGHIIELLGFSGTPDTGIIRDENRKYFDEWEIDIGAQDCWRASLANMEMNEMMMAFGYTWQEPYVRSLQEKQ